MGKTENYEDRDHVAAVCNELLTLILHSSATDFIHRLAAISFLCKHWKVGHNTDVICSVCGYEEVTDFFSNYSVSLCDSKLTNVSNTCAESKVNKNTSAVTEIFETVVGGAQTESTISAAVQERQRQANTLEKPVVSEDEKKISVSTVNSAAQTRSDYSDSVIDTDTVTQRTKKKVRDSASSRKTATLSCTICGRQFRLRQILAAHIVTHTGERRFACRYPGCEKRFGQTSTRNYHERTHSEQRPYICSHCGLGYKQPSYLKIHVARMHASESQQQHQCETCSKSFKVARALVLHVQNAHGTERQHVCDACPKRFKMRQQLLRHYRALHSNETHPWKCLLCDKVFTQSGNLRTHMRTHTGEKPYICRVCDMQFAHSGSLKAHMATHCKTGTGDDNAATAAAGTFVQ